MFERVSGFFSGASSGGDLRNADAFMKKIDKTISKLHKSGHAEADAHLQELIKLKTNYGSSLDGYSNAMRSGVNVDTAKEAFTAAHGEVKGAFKKANSFILRSNWVGRGQKFGSFMASTPGKIVAATVGIPALLVGGAMAAGVISGSRSKRDMASREELMDKQVTAMNSEVAALQQQNATVMAQRGGNTLMGLDPVHGEHAQRVVAGRNGGMGIDTANPSMTAANFEAVPARG